MFWIVGCLAVAGALAAVFAVARRNDGEDMGAVSTQWLAEYRQSQES